MGAGVWASIGTAVLALATRLVDEVGPRPAGSPEAVEAQGWVGRELRARGWTPRVFGGGATPPTVYACRSGRDRSVVLFLAHTDTVHAAVPGANDNAAAIAVLLVAAEDLPKVPERTVCLAFPDAEELGLLGSEAFAAFALRGGLGGRIDQVMALDLVGQGRLTHNGLGPAWGTARLRDLMATAPAEAPWVYRGVSWGLPHMERSDHGPFGARGVPASHLMARGPSGVFWAYHTERDTPEVLQTRTLNRAVRTVRKVARAGRLPVEAGDPAVVLPDGSVLPGSIVVLGTVLGAALGGLAGLRVDRTVASAVGQGLAASLVFGTALALALAGRPLHATLADPALLAAWCGWGALVLAWPWPASARAGRALAGVPAAAAALTAWAVGPVLALPLAVSAVAAALAGRAPAFLLAPLALWPAGYLVRPDAVRELAFHGLVPAVPWLWAALHGGLTVPLLALVQGRALARGARRWGPVVALVAGALAAVVAAWLAPVEAAPLIRGTVRWPGGP